ncbi:MAG: TlpA disulfide reductase family protein [Bacteroidales bacterium]|nr:TlpA disulfide reductase family protein [Bacteroidales bacterium]
MKNMKNRILIFKAGRLMLLCAVIVAGGCKKQYSEREFLAEVSENLQKIKSATYFSTVTASAPGDTLKFSEPRTQYVKIFINRDDTLVGSGSLLFKGDDTTEMTGYYDGIARGSVNSEERYVRIDSFRNDPYPFRLVHYPFYTKINEIIKYSLTTADSISTVFGDYGDSLYFGLKIYDKHVYFHIRPIVIKNEYIPEDEISQFDIWFLKADGMPYRMRSRWHHTTVFEEIHGARFNTTRDTFFTAADYFPEGFEIVQLRRDVRPEISTMTGMTAPDWILRDTDEKPVALKDLKSRVVLIQFTGIGCGPCHMSLPFLRQLAGEYGESDLSLVSIETWSKNIEGIRRYTTANDLNHLFLLSEEEVTKAYGVKSVPVFFIIDEKRVIRKVISGYSKDTTDTEIRAAIRELI